MYITYNVHRMDNKTVVVRRACCFFIVIYAGGVCVCGGSLRIEKEEWKIKLSNSFSTQGLNIYYNHDKEKAGRN